MEKVNPLISVALCTYNGAKHLEEQLQSIVRQSYKNIEIIAVDDCSKDNTVSILEKYKGEANFKIHINSSNLGYVKNFEKAVSLCEGDYIALCDQDDIWELNKLEVLLKEIGDNNLVYADSEIVNSNGEPLHKKISSIRNFVKGHHPEAFLFHNCIAGHTSMFKKELKQYIFPFPKEIYHDWWISFAASATGKITYTDQCLVKYRQHEATNTDMLHLRTAKRIEELDKSKKVDQKTIEIVDHLSIFYNFKYLHEKDRAFIGSLIKAYSSRMNSIYSISLFSILFRGRKTLYYIQKDPWIYKIVHILKEPLGSKIKKTYYKFKEKKSSK